MAGWLVGGRILKQRVPQTCKPVGKRNTLEIQIWDVIQKVALLNIPFWKHNLGNLRSSFWIRRFANDCLGMTNETMTVSTNRIWNLTPKPSWKPYSHKLNTTFSSYFPWHCFKFKLNNFDGTHCTPFNAFTTHTSVHASKFKMQSRCAKNPFLGTSLPCSFCFLQAAQVVLAFCPAHHLSTI